MCLMLKLRQRRKPEIQRRKPVSQMMFWRTLYDSRKMRLRRSTRQLPDSMRRLHNRMTRTRLRVSWNRLRSRSPKGSVSVERHSNSSLMPVRLHVRHSIRALRNSISSSRRQLSRTLTHNSPMLWSSTNRWLMRSP